MRSWKLVANHVSPLTNLLQVFVGIKLVSKLGLAFFAIVLYTMLSFYLGLGLAPRGSSPPSLTGLSWTTFKSNWSPGYPHGKSFSTAVSLFFPCFTGILRCLTLPNPHFLHLWTFKFGPQDVQPSSHHYMEDFVMILLGYTRKELIKCLPNLCVYLLTFFLLNFEHLLWTKISIIIIIITKLRGRIRDDSVRINTERVNYVEDDVISKCLNFC